MKIGIISDTHDNLIMLRKAADVFREENVDLIMHAGDHIAPFTAPFWSNAGAEVLAIFGNNDGDHKHLDMNFRKVGKIFERPREFIIDGNKIIMLHEPDNLSEIVKSEKYDVVIYGHTHRKKIYKEGKTLVINPGEACGWITGTATCVILDLDTGEIKEKTLGTSPLEPINL